MYQESVPYQKKTVKRNPGKKFKGMDTSAQSHQRGPRVKGFIDNPTGRAQSLCKRTPTLFSKVYIQSV